MRLKNKKIGDTRYFHKFKRPDDSIIEIEILKSEYDYAIESPIYLNAAYLSSYATIGFDTPTKRLNDGEYATQENGFHWVKIPDCELTKLPPEYIENNVLSAEGEALIVEMKQNN